MSDTLAVRRKIEGAGDLESVVRSMKALAASSIGQYEKSVLALADYYRTVELGLAVCLRKRRGATAEQPGLPGPAMKTVSVIVFGSDQGLVGQFNDVLADFVAKALDALPGEKKVWAVGERVHARLTDAGLAAGGTFRRADFRQWPSRRSSGRFSLKVKRITARTAAVNSISSTTDPSPGRPMNLSVNTCCPWMKNGSPAGPSALADQKPTRGHRLPGADASALIRELSFCFALPGLCRIAGQRKREPTGRHATSREKHRRDDARPESDLPPPASDFHRCGIIRCPVRLRILVQRRTK